MNLKIPYALFEEHHEAFYYWGLAVEKGWIAPRGNTLFHVDHHDDMESGAYPHNFETPFSSLQERKEFTYHCLGIADFIVPALYEQLFDSLYMMKAVLPKPFGQEQRLVQLSDGNCLRACAYIPFLHAEYKKSNHPNYRFFSYYEGSLSDTPPMDNVVLDIDLDYFCWDDSLRTVGAKRIELTKEGFEDYQNNPYHPFRILPRKLLDAVEENGRYYLQYQEPLNMEAIADEERIQKRMDRFFQWMSQQPWQPRFLSVCRSAHSGYLPAVRAAFVERQFMRGLEQLWGE